MRGPRSDQSCYCSMQMCMVFDFLPKTPTSPLTAATLLGGGSVPGILRQRPLRRVPRRRCRCLGPAAVDDVSPQPTFSHRSHCLKIRKRRMDIWQLTSLRIMRSGQWDASKPPMLQAMEVAANFNACWAPELRLFQNDCRNYCQQLAQLLMNDTRLQIV